MKFYDREPFDDQRVEAIRIQLENLAAAGNPSDYQVILDDMEIVPRTSDTQRFTSFYDLIGPKSEDLIINVYSGSTRHKRGYHFYFNGSKQQQGSLNGVDVQKTIDNEVARHTLQFENKLFSDQIKDLKDEILALEDENERIKTDNQSLREDLKKATGENGIANSVMGGVERLFNRYMVPPQQPGLSGAPQQQQNAAPAGTINVPIQEYDNFRQFAVLAEKFDPNTEFGKVLSIIKYLSDNKPALDETISFLTEEEPENQ